MSISPQHVLAARAAGVYERAAALDSEAVELVSVDPAPELALRAWTQAFAQGDTDAFSRRLTWDGLTLETARAAVAMTVVPAEAAAPGWTIWVERIARSAREIARDVSSGTFVRDPLRADQPFEEIWSACERAARQMLDDDGAWSPEHVSRDVMAAFGRQLAVELARQGELALFTHFKESLAADREAGYADYVVRVLEAGLAPIFDAFPVLARHISSLMADWVASTRELFERFQADRPALAEMFGRDPGGLIAAEPGLSDPHHGRRRVAALTLSSGLRLVYKPRSLGLEAAFAGLVEWVNRVIDPPLPVLRVLDRGDYGWVEFAHEAPQSSRAGVARYYRKSGALVCLGYMLRGRDLHMENVVATADGPVLIDLEMLVQPLSRSTSRLGDLAGPQAAAALVEESSLATGLLTLVEITHDGEAYDSSGLRGQTTGPLPFPRRVWKDLGAAALHAVDEPTFAAPGRHRVLLDGVVQDPGDYRDDLLAGFIDTYRAVLERREDVLAAGGPLAAFGACSTRVLPRPTNQYAMLAHVLATPRYQRDGVLRSTAIDVLHRAFCGAVDRPDLWTMAVEERRAFDRLDIPYFSVPCDGVDVTCEGRMVAPGYFAQSGIGAVAARVGALSMRDLEAQTALLSRALGESVRSTFRAPPPATGPDDGVDAPHAFAEWIGRELLSRATRGPDGLRWPYRGSGVTPGWTAHCIYDGTLGPALFFSALAATSDSAEWRRHAHDALAPVHRWIQSNGVDMPPAAGNIGGVSGLGSIVYGLTVCGALLDDHAAIAGAGVVARWIPPHIDADALLDVLDGSAGAALALLAHFGVTGDRGSLEAARDCGDHLIARGVVKGDLRSWPGADGRALVGFAHGAAGIVHALAALYRATGAPRFRDAAADGARFVHAHFLPALGNFAIADSTTNTDGSGVRAMTAWCHGAPGIAVATASVLDICQKGAILSEFEAALRTTARAEPAQADHVCCGAIGRADVLLTIGRRLQRADAIGAAADLATSTLRAARRRGHFRLSGAGSDYRVFDPGFFRGLSGIGYQLLRMSFPSRVPSVASLEAPGIGKNDSGGGQDPS